MEGKKYTVLQLKETLRQAGLLQRGTKPELLKRLYEFDPSGAWRLTGGVSTENVSAQSEETVERFSRAEDDVIGGEDEATIEERRCVVRGVDSADRGGREAGEKELRDREFELMRRERDLMRKELEFLRREMRSGEAMRNVGPPATSASPDVMIRPQVKALAELMSEPSGAGSLNGFKKRISWTTGRYVFLRICD